jgi:ParD-like antitoxin of type II bacterial toxin-antitoxin system
VYEEIAARWHNATYRNRVFLELTQGATMGFASIKIPAPEMALVRAAATLQNRSVSSQVVHWIRLGQAFERDPNVGFGRVEQALKAQISVDDLNGVEQEAYFDQFEDAMWTPTPQERTAFTELVMKPGAVGLDENDLLVMAPTPTV